MIALMDNRFAGNLGIYKTFCRGRDEVALDWPEPRTGHECPSAIRTSGMDVSGR